MAGAGSGAAAGAFAKGESERKLGGDEAVTQQQAGFGRADEQEALRPQQAPQHVDGAVLGGAVEVDQQVAAENHVVELRAGQKAGGKQVALLKMHLPRTVSASR